ncbi:ATP-binding cassette domain-containing protein [Klebsiella pneumoniae]|uniref:ATP-binding cassette domain-containing protein n=1 Tax=Klebsiella pneumoniae TaxID=573 RepID=UPI003CEA082B
MKRIAIVGAVGAGKTTLFNALQGNYSSPEKRRRWNLTIVATSIHPGNISAIRAGITP